MSQIKLWYIPDVGLSCNLTDWLMDLHGHKRRVGYIEWHPTAENVLASASFDCMVCETKDLKKKNSHVSLLFPLHNIVNVEKLICTYFISLT